MTSYGIRFGQLYQNESFEVNTNHLYFTITIQLIIINSFILQSFLLRSRP